MAKDDKEEIDNLENLIADYSSKIAEIEREQERLERESAEIIKSAASVQLDPEKNKDQIEQRRARLKLLLDTEKENDDKYEEYRQKKRRTHFKVTTPLFGLHKKHPYQRGQR